MNVVRFQSNNIGIGELSISFVIIDFAISPITVYRIGRFAIIIGDGERRKIAIVFRFMLLFFCGDLGA